MLADLMGGPNVRFRRDRSASIDPSSKEIPSNYLYGLATPSYLSQQSIHFNESTVHMNGGTGTFGIHALSLLIEPCIHWLIGRCFRVTEINYQEKGSHKRHWEKQGPTTICSNHMPQQIHGLSQSVLIACY